MNRYFELAKITATLAGFFMVAVAASISSTWSARASFIAELGLLGANSSAISYASSQVVASTIFLFTFSWVGAMVCLALTIIFSVLGFQEDKEEKLKLFSKTPRKGTGK